MPDPKPIGGLDLSLGGRVRPFSHFSRRGFRRDHSVCEFAAALESGQTSLSIVRAGLSSANSRIGSLSGVAATHFSAVCCEMAL